MPNAKNNAKLTGDTHLPDVEADDLPQQEGMSDAVGADGTPRGRAQDESTAGRGINQAGFIKDKDAQTSDSYGNTRDSGEKPR